MFEEKFANKKSIKKPLVIKSPQQARYVAYSSVPLSRAISLDPLLTMHHIGRLLSLTPEKYRLLMGKNLKTCV